MAALQVTCIHLRHGSHLRQDSHLRQGSGGQVGGQVGGQAGGHVTTPTADALHEQITHLGGDDWYMTRAAVIASIEALTHTFYLVNESGRRSVVGIITRGGGRVKYLRGYGDGWNDDLLALPQREDVGQIPPRSL